MAPQKGFRLARIVSGQPSLSKSATELPTESVIVPQIIRRLVSALARWTWGHCACQIEGRQWGSLATRDVKGSDEKAGRKSDEADVSGLQRHRIRGDRTARAAGPQNLSAAVQGMRWQGTDTKGGQLRR